MGKLILKVLLWILMIPEYYESGLERFFPYFDKGHAYVKKDPDKAAVNSLLVAIFVAAVGCSLLYLFGIGIDHIVSFGLSCLMSWLCLMFLITGEQHGTEKKA